ncbi:MAG: UbiA prenyltransferase family protein [Candidatus Helarchaeota archaeon]
MATDLLVSFGLSLRSRAREVIFVYVWTSIIGLIIASEGLPSFLQVIKLFLAVAAVGFSIYLYNDLCDLDEDLTTLDLGKPSAAERPLGQGLVSKRRMKGFIIFLAFMGLLAAFLINLQVFLLQLVFLALGLAYSTEPIRLKKRFIFKQMTIALGGVLSILSGGFTVGVISGKLLFLIAVNFVLYFALAPLTDLRDMKWDRQLGIKSFPVVWGPRLTVRLMLTALIAMVIAFTIGFYQLGFNLVLPILGITILMAWIYVIYPLFNKWNDQVYLEKVIFKRSIPFWFTLLIVVLIGSLPIY